MKPSLLSAAELCPVLGTPVKLLDQAQRKPRDHKRVQSTWYEPRQSWDHAEKRAQQGPISLWVQTLQVEHGRRVQKMDPDSATWQEAITHKLNYSKSHLHITVMFFTTRRVKQWNWLSRKAVESQYLETVKTQLGMTKLGAVNPTVKKGIWTRTWLDNLQRLLLTTTILKFLDVFWYD